MDTPSTRSPADVSYQWPSTWMAAQIASTGQGIIAHFTVNSAGSFSVQTIATRSLPQRSSSRLSSAKRRA